ncbi:ABC transporter substrate-binding protein [Enterobacter kobei]|uniref:ABC transporter substrate-binding protein n=1 Tax=Enterobacter kobei TaxID=208224 RepID=UPI002075C0BB|nr:ABC transporter substrate-binding protein [Enterobacter kobei]MCM7487432.1 ABC transporter substrate-binding protein [Enterobacter kobei]
MPKNCFINSVLALAVGASLLSGSAVAEETSSQAGNTVVIIERFELGHYNPLLGHGRSGESLFYQGLYRIETGVFDRQPDLVPTLASGPAVASQKNRVWTIPLRKGIKFSDGTTFGPEDVVATYQAFIDPRSASSEIATWDNIEKVEATTGAVVFTLKEPMANFDRRLINGIAPSEAFDFAHLNKAEMSSLNQHPIGTGPYALSELRPDQAILTARTDYWGPQPQVEKIVLRYTPDDSARAQQLKSGEGDGTSLPADLAATFTAPEYKTFSVKSGDWRGVSLPAGNPVTGDDAIRLAVNYAVNRNNMVKYALKGHGVTNSTYLAPFFGEAYDPAEEFIYSPEKAKQILDEAGWKTSQDGVRVRNGQRAAFDIIYFPNRDRSRRDLTLMVASDLKKIGIEVTPVARDSKSVTRDVYASTSVMAGSGVPYSVDSQVYHILHSKYAEPGVGASWDNASDYRNPVIDRLLDSARAETDPHKQAGLYRELQKEYHRKPAMLQLVYLNHIYVQREMGYKNIKVTLEPHSHNIGFGPWFTIDSWEK